MLWEQRGLWSESLGNTESNEVVPASFLQGSSELKYADAPPQAPGGHGSQGPLT